MKRHALMLAVLFVLGAGAAMADTPRECVTQARDELQSCSSECINNFRNDRFVCRNVEPGCGRECLGRREGCIETATEPLVECLGGCQSTLDTAKDACHTSCADDTACLDACIDSAQVDAFTCRDNCRETWRLDGGTAAVEVCRATFRECVKACPPAQ
jgi:hypothetical protein